MIYLFVAAGLLSGCTTIGKEAVPSEEEPPAETAELAEEESAPSLPENQSMERETVEENPKAYYLLELERIDLALAKLENSYKNGSTAALKAGEAESLRRWDKALNEIYSVIRSQLSSEEMEELRLKQLDWISVRELTKERCFFLVNTYLKEDAI